MHASLIRSQIRRELRTQGMGRAKPAARVLATLLVVTALAEAPMRAVEAAVA